MQVYITGDIYYHAVLRKILTEGLFGTGSRTSYRGSFTEKLKKSLDTWKVEEGCKEIEILAGVRLRPTLSGIFERERQQQ